MSGHEAYYEMLEEEKEEKRLRKIRPEAFNFTAKQRAGMQKAMWEYVQKEILYHLAIAQNDEDNLAFFEGNTVLFFDSTDKESKGSDIEETREYRKKCCEAIRATLKKAKRP
jgi:hypothetical protein